MGKNYGLTDTEMQVMEFFWENEGPHTFKELMNYFNEKKGKQWKKQTLSTYLVILQKANLIGANMDSRFYSYYALITKEEHIHKWTKSLIRGSFDNSIGNFLTAFTGGKKLSKKEAEELKKLI